MSWIQIWIWQIKFSALKVWNSRKVLWTVFSMLFPTGTATTSILSFAVSFVSLITADSAVCHFYSRELLYDFSQPLNHWSCSDCHSLRDYHANDINHSARHEICQNFYTTRFWGQKFYTRKGRKLGLFLLTMKQQRCISNLSKFC